MHRSYALPGLASLAGVVLAAIAFLRPETGVTGTAGALLALVGATATALGSVLLMLGRPRGWLVALSALAAILTALAAWFLMQWALAAVMALAFVGLLLGPAMSRRGAAA